MKVRQRKFVATIAMLVFVLVYALLVMVLAQPVLRDASGLVAFVFYAVGGLAWVLPMIPLIRWMDRPDPPAPNQATLTRRP